MNISKQILIIFILFSFFALAASWNPYPSQYNLKDKNLVSSAKKQAWGTCWAHGAISSLESNLMKSKIWKKNETTTEADLSEYHLDKYNGFNKDGLAGDLQAGWYSGQGPQFKGSNTDHPKNGLVVHLGGDYHVAAAYLSNTLGAVEEKLTPKISFDNNDHQKFGDHKNVGVLYKNNYSYYFPKHIEWLTLEGNDFEKRNKIKKAIKKYGAVASAQKMNERPIGFAPDGLEIHVNLTNTQLDHSISLIGWDDQLLFNKMKGAWLVKDSDHKDEKTGKHIGYFYLMYDDLHAAKNPKMGGVVFRGVEKRKNNIQIYSHSLHGHQYITDQYFYQVANQFKIKGNEKLEAISIYTVKEKTFFTIKVIKNNQQISAQDFYQEFSGLHYLEWDKKIHLSSSDRLKIVLEYKNTGYSYDASFEMEVLLKSTLPPWGKPLRVYSIAKKGQSFFRLKKDSKWKDFSSYKSKRNGQWKIKHARENNTANFTINAYTIPLEGNL